MDGDLEAAAEERAYHELQGYTLSLGDPAFIHQHVVDAWSAQHAQERTKAIALTFALVGLYLHVERGFSGRQVQRVHMALARRRRVWPSFALPRERGAVTAIQVMAAPAGSARDRAITQWCASVWGAFREHREHRKKQFAMIGPATNTRVEVGLNMKGLEATDRLQALPAGQMCNYKVRLTDVREVDAELIAWIRRAYEASG